MTRLSDGQDRRWLQPLERDPRGRARNVCRYPRGDVWRRAENCALIVTAASQPARRAIDLRTNRATPLATLTADAPERIAWTRGRLWITGRGTDLLEVNPSDGSLEQTIDVLYRMP